jgi:hypothetical protein
MSWSNQTITDLRFSVSAADESNKTDNSIFYNGTGDASEIATAVVLNLVIGGALLLLFEFLRIHWPRVYAPRTYEHSGCKHKTPPMPGVSFLA